MQNLISTQLTHCWVGNHSGGTKWYRCGIERRTYEDSQGLVTHTHHLLRNWGGGALPSSDPDWKMGIVKEQFVGHDNNTAYSEFVRLHQDKARRGYKERLLREGVDFPQPSGFHTPVPARFQTNPSMPSAKAKQPVPRVKINIHTASGVLKPALRNRQRHAPS